MTTEEVDKAVKSQGGVEMTGSYLRPFTINFSLSVKI